MINLIQENRFGSRKRGSNTIPAKILRNYNNQFIMNISPSKRTPNINFYRQPDAKIFKNLLFTYSKSKHELIKDNIFFEKTKYLFLKNNNKIFSNGFYYSKYYNMKFYPTYFYELTIDSKLSIVNYQSKQYKYGIYNRAECQDKKVLLNYLKNNDISERDVLVFGGNIEGFDSCTDQDYFFNNFETYLINNEDNDSVSNTLLECIYYKKKLLLMNNLAIANDNKAMLEALNYYGYDRLFKKLNNLNTYCWSDLTEDNFRTKVNYIDNIFKRSINFTNFLKEF